MNKRGDIELRDFGTLLIIYILLITTVASSTNISISDNSSLPSPEKEPILELSQNQTQEETQENQTEQESQNTTQAERQVNQSSSQNQTDNQTHPIHEKRSVEDDVVLHEITTSQTNQTTNSTRTELIQHPAKVDEKVKWTKRVYTNNTSYKIKIPTNAQEISTAPTFSATSHTPTPPHPHTPKYLEISYKTPAPQKTETTKSYGKEVLVYSEDHYQNITATTQIDFNLTLEQKDSLKIYWQEESRYLDFEAFDQNNDNLIDYIEWQITHLSNQTFQIILITDAQHLDENKTFIQNIYNEVSKLDDIWSPTISDKEYIRITFEEQLDNTKDITIYPRIVSGNPRIEVYEQDGTEIIAEFTNLTEGKNQIYLTKLTNLQDTFDLKILDGSLEFDYIVDPVYTTIFYEDWEAQNFNSWTNSAWEIAIDQARDSYSAKCAAWVTCDMNTNNNTDTSAASRVNVTFEYRDDDLDAGDVILYFNDTAGNWDTIANIDAGTLGATDDAWHTYTISTTDIQYRHSGFAVRFYATPKNNENYWVDNIDITPLLPGPPNVTLDHPSPDYIYASASPLTFNATVTSESQLTSCALWANHTGTWHENQTETVTGTTNTTSFDLSLPSDNSFIWNIKCTDSTSQTDWGDSNRTVLADRTYPLIDYTASTEENDTTFSRNWVYAEVAITETNFANITFSLYNLTSLVNQVTLSVQTLYINWTDLPDTTYFYNITTTDVASNTNSTETRQIILDTTAPTGNNLSPPSGSHTNNGTQNLTVSVQDPVGLKDATLFIYNSTGHLVYSSLVSLVGLTTATLGVVYDFLYDDVFTWFYRVRDSVDNEYNTTSSTLEIDTTAPEITFISPTETDGDIFLRDWILLNTSIYEENYANVTFYLYNQTSLVDSQFFSDTTREYNFTSLPDETYSYNVSSYDSADNEGYSETRTIILDTTAPTLYFSGTTEENDSVITGTEITAEVTATELNEQNITFALYDETGTLAKPLSTFTDGRRTITWTLLSEGTYFYNVTMVDKVSLLNSTTTRKITLDNTPPTLDFISPTEVNTANKSQTWIFINTSSTEDNFANITFTLYNQTHPVNSTTYQTLTESINFTNLPNEIYTYNVTITDRASQSTSTSTRTITLDTVAPVVTFIPSTEPNETIVNRNWIYVNGSVVEDYPKQAIISLYLDGTLYDSYDVTGSGGTGYNITDLDSNIYDYNITVTDWAGNEGYSETRWIGLDYEGPVISITNPIQSKTYSTNESLPLDFNAHDEIVGIDTCWYNLDNGANTTINCATNTTFNTTVDSHTLYLFANDTFGETSLETVSFSISVTGPAIELTAPTNDTFYSSSTLVDFNFTAADPDTVDTCSLYGNWNGGWHLNDSYVVLQAEVNSSYFSAQVSEEGSYIWNIECNDTVGYYSFALENYTFKVDVTDPQVFFSTGTEDNDTDVGRNWVFADANIIENNFQNITFNLYNSSGLVETDSFSDDTREINWTDLASGIYYYNITVYDKAARAGHSETRLITVDLIAPTGELLTPTNGTHSNSLSQNLTVNFTDSTGLLNATLYVLNATGHIVYSEVVELGGALIATIGVVYNFLQEGIYTWLYSIEDIVGNKVNTTANTIIIDTTAPLIDYAEGTLISGLILKQDNIFVNTTSSDDYWANITFNLYDSDEHLFTNTFTGSTRQINWTLLSDEIYFYNVTAYDEAGNSNSTETRNITLDNTAPTIDFGATTKPDAAFISGDTITIDATVTEENEANITFYLYNSTGYKIRENTFSDSRRTISWNLLSEGTYYYNITIIDKVSLSASTSTRSITIDDTLPQITYGFGTLENDSYVNQDWLFLKATLTEDNFQNITFTLYNATGTINQTTFTDTTREINFTNLVDTTYWYEITTADKAGNSNTTETRYATLDSILPLVDFTSPTEIDNFNKTENWIYINTTISETNFANITFFLYDDTSLINQTTFSDSTRTINFTNLDSDIYWYNVTVTDKASNSNSTETRKIGIDYVGPSIQITSPEETAYNYNESIPLTYIVTDAITEPNICWYNLDNGANTTTDCAGSTTFNVTDGEHTLHFFANDTLGNTGYKNVTFLISVTGPTIVLLAPEDDSFYSQATEVFFNYTAEDPDLTESCSLYGTWNGGWHENQTDLSWIFTNYFDRVEDFENATLDNWTNTNWAIDTDQAIGTYSAACTEIINCDMSSKNDTYASSATLINITFRYRDDDCDAGDAIIYFNNSLGNWDNMGNIDAGTLGTSDDAWNTHTISTIDAQYQHSGFSVRFFADPENNENYWIDEIKINYEEDYNKPSGNFTLNLSEEGTHEWNILCNDTIGYVTSAVNNYSITFDVTDPVVDFGANTLPDNSNVSQDYIYINSSIIENNFQNITFYIYNSTSLVASQFFNDTTRDYTFTNLDDGTYYYNITVYDSADRSGSSPTRTILLDTTSPTGSPQSPSHNSYTNNATQNLTATLSDENGLTEAILYIFNSTGLVYSTIIPLAGQLSVTIGAIYEFLADGIYEWFYQAEDLVGNKYNTTNYTLIIDTTLPQIDFIPSTLPDNTYISQDYIYLNSSVTETNFQNITFSLYNGEGPYDAYTFTTSKRDINYTLLPDDEYFYNITVWDKANNSNTSETQTITLDNVAPTINYISPTEPNAANKSQDWIFINSSITETNFANITFRLYFEGSPTNTTVYQTEIGYINFTDLSDGDYSYNATIVDKTGLTSTLPTRTITLDETPPILFFIAPTEDSGLELEQEWIYMDTFLTEDNFKNITFFLYNSSGLINQTTYLTFISDINFTASSENQTYFYNATAFDFAGNQDSTATRNITLIDTTFPSLTLTSPENKTYVYNTSLRIEYEASDIHLDSCWYNLNSGTNITLPNCQGTTIDVADEQQHTITLFTNDTMGYTASENVTFFVNSSLVKIPESYVVQRGSIFTDGLSTPTIEEIHPSKAFIIHTARGGDNSPASLQVTSDFTDPEEIEFQNYESGGGVLVEYSVIGGPNISVQRGEVSYTTEESISLPITQINLSNTFIILNNRLNSSTASENVDGFWTAKFTDDSNINFTRGSNLASGTLSYQVVSWEGTTVQNATSTISDTSSTTAEPISSTNLNSSFMVFSRRITGSTTIENSIIKGKIKNSTNLEFSRVGSTGETIIESFTIESEIFQSQHGNHTHAISSSPQYDNIPKSLVNTSRSFDIHSNDNAGATTSFATAALTQNIYNQTAVVLQKGVAAGAGETLWSAIEIIELDSPIIDLTYPANNANFSTYTIPSFNFTISDESAMQNCSLYGNWSTGWHLNQTIQNPVRGTALNFSGITLDSDNYYSWNIKCIDAYDNTGWNSTNFTFAAFLPPTKPTVYSITQTSNDGLGNITLLWNTSNHSETYEIYAGVTIPTMSYLSETTNLNYSTTNFAGQKRMFYQIKATNPVSQNSSEIFGAHLYELEHNTNTARNWIAFPSNFSYIANANQTLNEISQAIAFTAFNATTQSRVTCNNFSCPEELSCTPTNCNFKIQAGRGYELDLNLSESQAVNWSAVGKVHAAQTINLNKNATSFGKNWIALYANTTLTDAQGLIGDIPNADAVSRWIPNTQVSAGLIPSPFPWIPGFVGNNFQLNLEEGYEVSVTSSTQWTQS